GSEPWKIKSINDMSDIKTRRIDQNSDSDPFDRDNDTLARSWAVPGTPGLEHRVGGLEKDKITGNVSMDSVNHEQMVNVRAEKVKRVENNIPDLVPEYEKEGDLLVVGWGGTYGSLHSAVRVLDSEGYKVGHAHFNYINPMPKNTEEVFSRFKKIIVCELNKGQLSFVLRGKYNQFEFAQYNKVQGLPFSVTDLTAKFKNLIKED
ncbi:MAG: 2-oxoacid:acceptor oxidoreductase subunit alpha, partial [Flavobacteriaceae bacterium]|nr:2-oxoacid:acceptor oxidoreductase subunit alpha [Flavobacteriaceae bacterium]